VVPQQVQVKSIAALARGVRVMQLLQSHGPMGLADLHRVTAIPKASLLRILKTLRDSGIVWQRLADDAWAASFVLADLAGQMDREQRLAEVASPVLAALTAAIEWPSVLAVPRLTHMAVIETNAAHAYFGSIPLGPLGFAVNMLRSASGRAFLAFCEPPVRDAILAALARSDRRGDALARSPDHVARVLSDTRARGFGLRDPDFGGDFDVGRAQVDDGRDSLAVPVRQAGQTIATLNVTWTRRVLPAARAVALLAPPALRAAEEIGQRLDRVSPDEIQSVRR
jgi:IclR family mhp operon transcriptional activator